MDDSLSSTGRPTALTPAQAMIMVIDTNVVLDLWVFQCPTARTMLTDARAAGWQWWSSDTLSDELDRVLGYPHIELRIIKQGLTRQHVLQNYVQQVQRQAPAPRSQPICKDPDDQKFIDLAVQHSAVLISKDRDMLDMKKRLARRGVWVSVPGPIGNWPDPHPA